LALNRKRIKDIEGNFITKPVTCYICKEKKAFHSMHGGSIDSGGKMCCDDCYPSMVEKNDAIIRKNSNYEMTEGDWQSWGNKKW
jgi:hypothetical protein